MKGKKYERIEDSVKILDRRFPSGEIDRADHEALRQLVLARSSRRRTGPDRALSTSWLALLAVLAVVSAVAITSMALTYGPWHATPDVAIVNYAYSASEVRVSVGTTVTWVNMDGVMHTVTFGGHGDHQSGHGVESGPLYHMDAWSYTFEEPGTYEYHCDPHPFMTGMVIVEG